MKALLKRFLMLLKSLMFLLHLAARCKSNGTEVNKAEDDQKISSGKENAHERKS